jgi:hypothetical protein
LAPYFASEFVLHGWCELFNTQRGIINNKSELEDQGRKLSPGTFFLFFR